LTKVLSEAQDIKLDYIFSKSLRENKSVLYEIKEKLEVIQAKFDTKIQGEFQQLNLLRANSNEIEISSLPLLQEKVNALANKIKVDNWIKETIKPVEFCKFTSDVEAIIDTQQDYFRAEKDLFTIEF